MSKLTIEGADKLRELAAKLREADPKIRRELGKSLRPSVKTVTADVQAAVRAAPSRGRGGLGRQRRAARTLARTRRLSDYRAREIALKTGRSTEQVLAEHRARQAARAEAGAGLRETIARSIAGSISTGSARTGVSVTWKVAAAKMPAKQRTLPKAFNSAKGWRHPVFGNRDAWVAQHGTPYFDVTIKRHQDELGQKIVDGMQKAADAILHE
jgi:hypothetical protein